MLEMTKAYLRSPGVWNLGVWRLGVGRLGIRLAIAAAILLPLGAFSAQADEVKVTIDNFTFTPPELKLKVGDTVPWHHHDDIPHTVVSAGKFRSKTMDTDNTFTFTFTAAGDYKYFCSLHPHMTGMIKVEKRAKPRNHNEAPPQDSSRPVIRIIRTNRA